MHRWSFAPLGTLVLASSAPHWPALDDALLRSLVLASSAPHWPALDGVVALVAVADETADVAADVLPGIDEAGDEAADVIPDVDGTGNGVADVIPDVNEPKHFADVIPDVDEARGRNGRQIFATNSRGRSREGRI